MKVRYFTLPNLLTLSNLLCGTAAAVFALMYEDLHMVFLLTIAAAAFDFSDGMAARLLRCPSPLGVQLDSLSDMVSFGVVPSGVLYVLYRHAAFVWIDPSPAWADWLGLLTAAVALCSALRLARFNIDTEQSSEFTGLPTPACALFFVSAGWLAADSNAFMAALSREVILLSSLVMAWLLISPVRMFSFKFHGLGWRENGLRYLFLAASLVALVAAGIAALPWLVVAYVAISAVRWAARPKSRPSGE